MSSSEMRFLRFFHLCHCIGSFDDLVKSPFYSLYTRTMRERLTALRRMRSLRRRRRMGGFLTFSTTTQRIRIQVEQWPLQLAMPGVDLISDESWFAICWLLISERFPCHRHHHHHCHKRHHLDRCF